ncbi:ABC transporter substrate-binding protein [uncultured Paenibacillus sp.]|uniref:ABC transporter substrate-binding protein n=1 Tax=uncultured Paenibacillus sp. TaxID=227322 RepID=UPI0015AEFB0C|nr:ABC transporter substrate-binding protein [uncultured Paenibacillus sp.]
MTKRSRLSLLLVLVLACTAILSACGGTNKEKGAEGTHSNAAENQKPVELIWYNIGTPQKDTDMVMAEVSKYTSEKIGVTVKMKQIDFGDYTQKMQVLTQSGEPMDILFTASWGFDYVQNARKGAFMELNDLLDKYGQGIKDTLDPAFLEGSKVDGKNYGIPANKELPAQDVWRFNKQWLDKYNLDISGVRSLESLEPLLKTIKENEPGVVPFMIDRNYIPNLPYDYIIQGLPMAVKLDTSDFKVVSILETPELKESLKTMRKYYQAGYIDPEVATTTETSDLTKTGNWFVDRPTTQPFADNLWTASLGYPVISTPATDPIIYNWSVMGSLQAISANSKHPVEAMKFLNLLNTDAYLRNLVDSGIEGVHYEKVGDNVARNLDKAKDYDMPSFAIGNMMLNYLAEGDPADKWEGFRKFNEEGVPAPLLGFNFDASDVLPELAALNNAKDQFWAPLMTGSVDPDKYLPKAIEQLKAAGLDKIIEEAQKQLDEWRAAQK